MRGAWGLIGALVLLAGLGLFLAPGARAPPAPRPPLRTAASPAASGPREAPGIPPAEGPSPAPLPVAAEAWEDEEALQAIDELPEDCTLRGRVVDDGGRPLARVWLEPWREVDGLRLQGVATDEQGRYALEGLSRHAHVLRAQAPGHVGQEFTTPRLVSGPNTFELVLRRATLVRGTVVDEAGRPVEDVSLSLTGAREPSLRTFGPGTSLEEGAFQLDAPAPGDYIAQLLHPDYLVTEQPVTAPAEGVRLVLRSGLALEVEVVDEAGRPVAGAQVGAQEDAPSGTHLGPQFPTDAAGRVTLKGLEPGRYAVVASLTSPGHVRTATARVASSRAETLPVRLRFEEGLPLSGKVVDGAGQPLEEVEVRVAPASLWAPSAPEGDPSREVLEDAWTRGSFDQELVTGKDGRFALSALRPGAWWVSARKEGYALQGATHVGETPAVRVSAGASGLRLVMTFLGAVRGRVVREDGTPLERFTVGGVLHLSSKDGRFSNALRTPGEQQLVFEAEGQVREKRTVWAREGEMVELGDVVLRDARGVRVRILDAQTARPVRGATVDLLRLTADGPEAGRSLRELFTAYPLAALADGADPGEPFTTLSTGRLLLSPVEHEPLLLEVRHPDYETERVALGATQLEVEVRLRPSVPGGPPP